MTTRQIIQEIKDLPRPDQEEVLHALESVLQTSKPETRFASKEQVEKASEIVFAKHDELFRKLAQ
jgi:hypothetical protein